MLALQSASLKLHMYTLDPLSQQSLKKKKLYQDLLSKHEYELMEMLDIPESLAQHLIQLTSELCCPPLVKVIIFGSFLNVNMYRLQYC